MGDQGRHRDRRQEMPDVERTDRAEQALGLLAGRAERVAESGGKRGKPQRGATKTAAKAAPKQPAAKPATARKRSGGAK